MRHLRAKYSVLQNFFPVALDTCKLHPKVGNYKHRVKSFCKYLASKCTEAQTPSVLTVTKHFCTNFILHKTTKQILTKETLLPCQALTHLPWQSVHPSNRTLPTACSGTWGKKTLIIVRGWYGWIRYTKNLYKMSARKQSIEQIMSHLKLIKSIQTWFFFSFSQDSHDYLWVATFNLFNKPR